MTTLTPTPLRPIEPTTLPVPGSPTPARPDTAARRSSVAVVVLLALAALAGLVVDGLYQDDPSLAAMYRGHDLVTLSVVVPLLAAALAWVRGGSRRARAVWLGGLVFATYNGALFVFGAAFNDLFLVHVAVVLLSATALVLGVVRTPVDGADATQPQPQPQPQAPLPTARLAAGLLAFLGVALGAMWIGNAVRFAVTGESPSESELVLPMASIHLGYALDLLLLVPAYVAAAVLLWRRRPLGWVVAPPLLVGGLLQQLAYVSALVFQARADIPGSTAFDPGEPLVIAAYALGAWQLLRRLGSRSAATSDRPGGRSAR